MPSPNLSEIITTTLRSRTGKLADDITKRNGLLLRLNSKGNVKTFSGGRTIVQELEYAENGTFGRYTGYEPLNIAPSDVFTAAEYDIKQAAVAVSISGLEQLQNSGKEALIDLLDARIKNAERTLMNNIALDCYSDGTGSSGKQIGGLQLLIADSPAVGTVGGIDASLWSFWRNVAFDATTDGGAAATSANITGYMNRVYLQLIRGADAPDVIFADNNYFRLYLESLQGIQQITTDKVGQRGFISCKYMNADVIADGGLGGGAGTNKMYFLNTDYLFFRPHKDRNFAVIGADRFATNQDALVKIMGWAGNMTCSNRSLQGILKD